MVTGIITNGKDLFKDEDTFVSLSNQLEIKNKIKKTIDYFFNKKISKQNIPFRGFIIEGPPGCGKTALIKRIVYELDSEFETINENVSLHFVDGGDIAAPKWGEGEQKLKEIFESSKNSVDKMHTIILFDDIETFILGRGANLAKEWHYSLNSIFFHELDRIDINKQLIIGTTNRSDLLDEALKSRLYTFTMEPPSSNELMKFAKKIGNELNFSDIDFEIIESRLKQEKKPTLRNIENFVIERIIEKS